MGISTSLDILCPNPRIFLRPGLPLHYLQVVMAVIVAISTSQVYSSPYNNPDCKRVMKFGHRLYSLYTSNSFDAVEARSSLYSSYHALLNAVCQTPVDMSGSTNSVPVRHSFHNPAVHVNVSHPSSGVYSSG